MRKHLFAIGLGIDLVISLAFVVVTSLLLADVEGVGLFASMVALAILMFIVTLALLIGYFSPRRRRSGDPD